MKRLHLVELQDLECCPRVIRDGVTEILRVLLENSRLSEEMADRVDECLGRIDTTDLIDLGSGGGGPVLAIADSLRERGHTFQWTLTDRYPNEDAIKLIEERSGSSVRYEKEPVDATNVPPGMDGLRTMFNCLHHFRPDGVKKIFRDAADSSNPILAVELPSRSLAGFTALLLAPLFAFLLRPFVKPVQLDKWILTYLIPAIPLVLFWDSVVTGLRAYSVDHLEEITSGVEGMNWEVGTWSPDATYWGSVTYVFGIPTQSS